MAGPRASPRRSSASSIISRGRLSSHPGRKSESNVRLRRRELSTAHLQKLRAGEPLLCQLERGGEAARKERSCDSSRELCFSFSLPAPRAPRENGWIPQERRLARGLSKATCLPRPSDVLKRFSNVWAPELSNAPAGEHPQAGTEGGSSSEAASARCLLTQTGSHRLQLSDEQPWGASPSPLCGLSGGADEGARCSDVSGPVSTPGMSRQPRGPLLAPGPLTSHTPLGTGCFLLAGAPAHPPPTAP